MYLPATIWATNLHVARDRRKTQTNNEWLVQQRRREHGGIARCTVLETLITLGLETDRDIKGFANFKVEMKEGTTILRGKAGLPTIMDKSVDTFKQNKRFLSTFLRNFKSIFFVDSQHPLSPFSMLQNTLHGHFDLVTTLKRGELRGGPIVKIRH